MRIRYWIATLLTALVGVLTALGVSPSALDVFWNDDAAPVEAPVIRPSVESHVSQMEGPRVDGEQHEDLRGEPLEVTGERGGLPRSIPLASPSQRGCTTKLVGNFSSRNGVRPSMFVLHYTVSANRDGFSDMDAIWRWFNSSASQASSHYIIDFEGHCYLIVAEANKAWTQGSFNSSSVSIEFIATGNEPRSAWAEAGLRKGALVVADSLKRWNIPLRFVDPVGCTVTAGVTDHERLECGNSHTDVEPNFPYDKFMSYVRAASATCLQYQIRDGGVVLKRSAPFRSINRGTALGAFLDDRQGLLVRRLAEGDNDVALKRVKAACG